MSVLGKRRRGTAVLRRQAAHDRNEISDNGTKDEANDIFRKYFEATFEPLPQTLEVPAQELEPEIESDSTEDSDSNWSGFTEDEKKSSTVHTVEHRTPEFGESRSTNSKMFNKVMISKASTDLPDPSTAISTEVDHSEAINLKHDLDLQRLLLESHLLEQSKSLTASGSRRHKANDLRMQSLGSKSSLFKQEKMPLSHRKGIMTKSASKESMRRRQAQENGIILERASLNTKKLGERRERAVDAPGVGKFRGGTLRLSQKDIMNINGPSTASSHRKSKGKR